MSPRRIGVSHGTHRPRSTFRLRRLRWIGAQQAILQRRPVEAADDGIHFVGVRRFDKRKAFRLLRFGIAYHFNGVRDQVLGCEPAPDIVRSHPSGQIAQKDGETHSEIIFNSSGWGICIQEAFHESNSMLTQPWAVVNRQMRIFKRVDGDFNRRGALVALGKAEALRGLKPAVLPSTHHPRAR